MSADNPVGADQASNPLISNSQTSSILTSDSESAQDDREKKRKKVRMVSHTAPRELVKQHLDNLKAPEAFTPSELDQFREQFKRQLKANDAVLVAHYYTDPEVQALAEETGGCVADSLEMARFGYEHPASTVVVAGVKFMGETAKILSPEKRVIMPTLEATCSLDIGCPVDSFSQFCDQHPDRTVVVYANTSAAVKARADWVVTSSIAVELIDHLDSQGESIIWAPDRHLGHYIQTQTGADMLLWDGSCIVHEEFKVRGLESVRAMYPNAAVLVHPESPASIIEHADVVGSTSQLIKAACEMENKLFIVATDRGIFYKMQQLNPDKIFIEAPTAGEGATCRSCAHCPWMAMNTLEQLACVFDEAKPDEAGKAQGIGKEVIVDSALAEQARVPLQRMLDFGASLKSSSTS